MVTVIIFLAKSYAVLCFLAIPYMIWLYLNAPEGYEDPSRGFVTVRPAKTMRERMEGWRKRSVTNSQDMENSGVVKISSCV